MVLGVVLYVHRDVISKLSRKKPKAFQSFWLRDDPPTSYLRKKT